MTPTEPRIARRLLPIAALLVASCATSGGPYSQQAQDLIRTCRYDEARRLLDARLGKAQGDEHAATLLQLGSLEENAGNLPQAVSHYRAAVSETRPRSPLRTSANLVLGMALARMRMHDGAIENLSAVIESRATARQRGGPLVSWKTYAALGVALAESGRLEAAAAHFELALQQTGRPRGSDTQAALAAWKRAAEEASLQPRPPPADSFWSAAYGDDAELTKATSYYELVPFKRVAPRYPPAALRRGIGGYVELEVSIDERGVPTHTRIIASEPPGVFDAAVVESVSQWKFQPHIEDCRAVPTTGSQRLEFRVAEDLDAPFDDDPFPGPESVPRVPLPRDPT